MLGRQDAHHPLQRAKHGTGEGIRGSSVSSRCRAHTQGRPPGLSAGPRACPRNTSLPVWSHLLGSGRGRMQYFQRHHSLPKGLPMASWAWTSPYLGNVEMSPTQLTSPRLTRRLTQSDSSQTLRFQRLENLQKNKKWENITGRTQKGGLPCDLLSKTCKNDTRNFNPNKETHSQPH